jgi:hypothetical protein
MAVLTCRSLARFRSGLGGRRAFVHPIEYRIAIANLPIDTSTSRPRRT